MNLSDVRLSEQNADIRLLILLAKVRLDPAELEQAQVLLGQIQSWTDFVEKAARNFSLPLLRRNLSLLDRTRIPQDVWDNIQTKANATAFNNMRMIAAQKTFRTRCLAPLGLDALFFKGVNLALKYYPDAGLRPCRDIDVLVPPNSLRQVLQKAISEGYTPVTPEAHVIPTATERDLTAILTLADSVTLVAPEGVVIDLQDHLDKHSGIFSEYDVFANAEAFDVAGESFATLPTAFLLNYLCHHHTRHTWSRLHWLSDLDAICTSESFDRTATLDLAETLGQRGTVEAGLELHQLMSTHTPWDDSPDLERGKTFLKLCILNLPGDLALEKRLSARMMGGEFMFHWQARPDLIAKARRGWWKSVFRPTVSQYVSRPLPRKFQWLYIFPRAFDLFRRATQRFLPTVK